MAGVTVSSVKKREPLFGKKWWPKTSSYVVFTRALDRLKWANTIVVRIFATGYQLVITVIRVCVCVLQECVVPTSRAKFLIVFSPDGTKLASTNGNHNVYVIDVATKKIIRTLKGHKRTPWTVAFHPSNNNILASGCLSGEVRVWNLDDVGHIVRSEIDLTRNLAT